MSGDYGQHSSGTATSVVDGSAPDAAFETEAVRTIGDVETLKALSDPLRLRILETMAQRTGDPWSVKELAAALGVPQTRLYHHVDQLVEHDLVRPVVRRVVSGIIETRYRVVARAFQLDRRLFASGSGESLAALHETLASVFDASRHEIEVAIHLGAIDVAESAPAERRLLLSRGVVRLAPARAAELRERLVRLIEEFDPAATGAADAAEDADAPGEGASAADASTGDLAPYGIVLAVYPMPRPDELAGTAERADD